MKTEDFELAKMVVDHFAEEIKKRNVFYNRKKHYHRLVCVDDDIFSAYIAAWYYHKIKHEKHYWPKVDCIGGFGLMSGKINPKRNGKKLSEAEMLKYTLIRLGVREEDIEIVCSEGTNTGQNLSSYALNLLEKNKLGQDILFCLTKRLAGRFYLTQIKQQPDIKANYAWKKPENECHLYNGKAFVGGLPYLSEVASIYDRYLRYTSGECQFMACLKEQMPSYVADAGKFLCKYYKLKMPEFSFLKIWQFIITYLYFLLHRKKCQKNLEENIQFWQERLLARYTWLKTVFVKDELTNQKVRDLRASWIE